MATLRIRDLLPDRILISRESARLLERRVGELLDSGEDPAQPHDAAKTIIDFEGVEGIAPSFLDELLSVFESFAKLGTTSGKRRLVIVNPPTRLSSKFEAVVRGHTMSVRALPDGSWELSAADESKVRGSG